MAIDPSIYGMIRQPQPMAGPVDDFAKILQIKALMGQGELQGLGIEEAKRSAQAGQSLRDLFSRGGAVRPEEVMAIDVPKGLQYQKSIQDREKHEADLMKIDRENLIAFANESRQRLPTINDQASWDAYRDEQFQRAGMFKTQQMRELAMKTVQAMPVAYNAAHVRAKALRAEDAFVPKFEIVTKPDGSQWRLDKNPFTNPEGKEIPFAPAGMTPAQRSTQAHQKEVEAQGRERLTREKSPTDAENVSAGYATRMATSGKIINELEKKGVGKPGLVESAYRGAGLETAANVSQGLDPDRQRYRQAQEDWVRAKLRKESGAVIAPDEMDREIRVYFPQIGDTGAVIKQKADSRKVAESAMKQAAGKAKVLEPQAKPATPQQPTAQPTREEIDAELRRRGVIR